MTSEIQNFTRDVCSRIKWKKARPLIQYELDDLMASIYQDYIDSGMEHGQAVAKTVEDTGEPSELAVEYNAEYRPNRPWEMIGSLVVILICGILCTSGTSDTPGQLYQNLQLAIVAIGAAFMGYILDTDLIGRYIVVFYPLYLLLLFASALIPLEKVNALAPFLFMLNPILFSVQVCTSKQYGRRGVYLSIATLYPTTILSLFSQAQGQQLISVFICLIIGLIAIWKGYYPNNDKWVWYVSVGLFAALLGLLFLSVCLRPAQTPRMTHADFQCYVGEAEFVGRSHLIPLVHELGAAHTVVQAILHVGVLGAVIVLACYAFYFWSGFTALRRIKSGQGQFLALAIILVLLFSFVAFFLSNIGVFPYLVLPVPFVNDGPAVVFSGLLAGLLMSVIRNGPVLFDHLPLISK